MGLPTRVASYWDLCMPLTIDSSRRAAYLRAMNIDCWVPRRQLDGAPPGHAVAMPLSAISVKRAAEKRQPAPQVQGKRLVHRGLALSEIIDLDVSHRDAAHRQSSAEQGQQPDVAVINEALAHATDASAPASQLAMRFELRLVQIDDWLLVDDVSALGLVGSAYRHWLETLRVAFGVEGEPVIEDFRWPLRDDGVFDTGIGPARDTLLGLLSRKLEVQPPKTLLLMGDAPVACLEQALASRGQQLRVLSTVGTADMWRDPRLKKRFWQQLQILFSR